MKGTPLRPQAAALPSEEQLGQTWKGNRALRTMEANQRPPQSMDHQPLSVHHQQSSYSPSSIEQHGPMSKHELCSITLGKHHSLMGACRRHHLSGQPQRPKKLTSKHVPQQHHVCSRRSLRPPTIRTLEYQTRSLATPKVQRAPPLRDCSGLVIASQNHRHIHTFNFEDLTTPQTGHVCLKHVSTRELQCGTPQIGSRKASATLTVVYLLSWS